MGTGMLFPVGLGGLEYEDRTIQKPLGQWIMGDKPPHVEARIDLFRAYIRCRRMAPSSTWLRPSWRQGWGFKTPFVAPYMKELQEAARLEGEPVQLVLTSRPFEDTVSSLRTQLQILTPEGFDAVMPQLVAMQERIADALKPSDGSAWSIPIDHLWSQPEQVRERLNEWLGLELPATATRGIGKGRF